MPIIGEFHCHSLEEITLNLESGLYFSLSRTLVGELRLFYFGHVSSVNFSKIKSDLCGLT